ncbi:MAG TPA: DNA alkylation repair protein [Candidatus Limosilactobacillus faecipullorum]|nr:DNA alkylation repair protein [Candidatus Limosilactobacillus faecipullorum]HJF29285.1 DNA alkylation repair protein [Ligilactobacillus saerimneri]
MYQEIKAKFEAIANPDQAIPMAKYMRNQFEFYGIKSQARKVAEKDLITQAKKAKQVEWESLAQIWDDPHREMQYFVADYLMGMVRFMTYENLPKMKKFVTTKQWWDTIDTLVKVYGKVGLKDKRVDALMLTWSTDEDFWLRRVAIEYQLLRKDKLKPDLLATIIENNLGSDEFFVNKAIGWALRDYSKTNPAWVQAFIESHQTGLSKLSIREGSKYLNLD